MTSEKISYFQDNRELQATVFYPKHTKKAPLVLIFPAWNGKDAWIEGKAKWLAELGYIGFAVDMYGQGKVGSSNEENAQLMAPFLEDRLYLQKRATAALECAKSLGPSGIAAMGFCFGGLCALDLARSGVNIQGVISFHGLLIPLPFPSQPIFPKILVLHGYEDPMVSTEQILVFEKEMAEQKADWQLHIYGNTMHAFTNPQANDPKMGTVYQPLAEKRAFLTLQSFLKELF